MRIPKRHERLARALLIERLFLAGWDIASKEALDRVDGAWPEELERARSLIKIMNSIGDWELASGRRES